MKQTKAGKWKVLGFTNEQREVIFQRLRSRAKGLIVKKHNKEYKELFKKLREQEIKKIKKELKIK